jgi:hypothetical protein
VAQNLQNGVLNITETGEPNNANCICTTDVSYSISGIAEIDIATITINGEVVWTANYCDDSLVSETWVSVDNVPLENFKYDTVYVANTYDELLQHPYFAQQDNLYIHYPVVDFATQSIVINYFAGCMFCDVKSAFCNINGYYWDITYYSNNEILCFRAENFMVYKIVPKIPANTNVEFHASLVACTEEETAAGSVLLLKVDYLTNDFEGGYELEFDNVPSSFNIRREYQSPGDFGYVKYFYAETGALLFHGTIIWRGEGQIEYPENLLPASSFQHLITEDLVYPQNGFEKIGVAEPEPNIDYTPIWQSVQGLVKVREYLQANPTQKVKVFLYTPCVGVGDPAHWKWILFLKK